MKRPTVDRMLVVAALLSAVAPAAAHGEQVAMLPIGNLLAVVGVGVIAFRIEREWRWRVVVVVLAALAAGAPYFLSNAMVPAWATPSGLTWFVVGFVPPVAVAAAVLLWRRRSRRLEAPGNQQRT